MKLGRRWTKLLDGMKGGLVAGSFDKGFEIGEAFEELVSARFWNDCVRKRVPSFPS